MLKKEQLILEIIEKNINTKANTYIENLSLLLGMMLGKDYIKYNKEINKKDSIKTDGGSGDSIDDGKINYIRLYIHIRDIKTDKENLKQRICRYIRSICNEIGINKLEELEKIYGYNYEYIELNILKGLCITRNKYK